MLLTAIGELDRGGPGGRHGRRCVIVALTLSSRLRECENEAVPGVGG
jgi:hypothetical protein